MFLVHNFEKFYECLFVNTFFIDLLIFLKNFQNLILNFSHLKKKKFRLKLLSYLFIKKLMTSSTSKFSSN